MNKVRVLVGTRKGAFILTSDGTRKRWKVSGPHFAGWEIYHMKGSPVNPDRIYASQTSAWFGQIIQRSDDGGKTWNPPGTKPEDLMTPEGTPKGGWYPENRITVEAALRHYTRDGAYANFDEEVRGTLTPGKLADLVVLSKNILTVPPTEIVKTKVLLTVMGGRDTYRDKDLQ